MDLRQYATEGVRAGLVGAIIIAVWFLAVDTLAATPFFTPAMLGSALFAGAREPAAVQMSAATIVGYTAVHVLVFAVFGMIAVVIVRQIERFPSTLFLAAVLFAAFEFSFYVMFALLGPSLLGAMALWSVAVGNAMAAVGMGWYIWRAHPQLRERLAAHPLGAAVEESADAYRAANIPGE